MIALIILITKILLWDLIIFSINIILVIIYIKLYQPKLTGFEDEENVNIFIIRALIPIINVFTAIYIFFNIIFVLLKKIRR